MKNLFLKKIISFVAVTLVVGTSVVFYNQAKSSTLDNISGYGWGASYVDDNPANGGQDLPNEETGGMGWLSFNCISGGNCGSADYGVNVDAAGNITGYAWSSNYGWLKFGGFDVTDFPTGGGTIAENAKVNLGNGQVTGWARFCSVAANSALCTGTVPTIVNGGWDGWVSLRGTNYGVTLTGNAFSGYAWGGDDNGKNVVGWIDFSQVDYFPVTDPTVSLTANPTSIPSGQSSILSWNGANIVVGPDSCTASGNWSGTKSYPMPVGGVSTGNLTTGTYIYGLSCKNSIGVYSPVSNVTISVGGATALDFHALPSPAYPPYTTTLSWNAVPTNPGLTNCVADSAPPLNVATVPTWNGPVSNTPGSLSVNVPYNPTNYKITCKDQFMNNVTQTISVPKGVPTESITLTNTPVTGTNPNFSTTISWTTVNMVANSCNATSTPNVPSWNSPNPKTPTASGSQAGVVVPVSAPAFTRYTLTCTGFYTGSPYSVSLLLNENSGSGTNKTKPKIKEN